MPREGDSAQANLTAADLILRGANELRKAGFETPRLDAEVLLRHLLRLDRAQLFIRMREPVELDIASEFEHLIEQRLDGSPVAYLTGVRDFMRLPFAVGPGVLVPRPETEILVEWAIQHVRTGRPRRIIDVGTGSGAIILSLANRLTDSAAQFIGVDISESALEFARRNRKQFGLEERVDLVCGDLLTWCDESVDLVLANLPYLRPDQLVSNPDLRAEPELALVSGTDGLDLIRRLFDDLPRVLEPSGAAVVEIDPSQMKAVIEVGRHAMPLANASILKDLSGLERFALFQHDS